MIVVPSLTPDDVRTDFSKHADAGQEFLTPYDDYTYVVGAILVRMMGLEFSYQLRISKATAAFSTTTSWEQIFLREPSGPLQSGPPTRLAKPGVDTAVLRPAKRARITVDGSQTPPTQLDTDIHLEATEEEVLDERPPTSEHSAFEHSAANALLRLETRTETLCELCQRYVPMHDSMAHVHHCIQGAHCKDCGRLFPTTDPQKPPPHHQCSQKIPAHCVAFEVRFTSAGILEVPLLQSSNQPPSRVRWICQLKCNIVLNKLILQSRNLFSILKLKSTTSSIRAMRTNVERSLHRMSQSYRKRCYLTNLFPLRTPTYWSVQEEGDVKTVLFDGRPWFLIKQSTIPDSGEGLFAARDFDKGHILGYYEGEYIDPADEENYQQRVDRGFCMLLSGKITVDGYRSFNGTQKIQHATSDANAVLDRSGSGCIACKQDLKAGQEIMFSYGGAFFSKRAKPAVAPATVVTTLDPHCLPWFTSQNSSWVYMVLAVASIVNPGTVAFSDQPLSPDAETRLSAYFRLRLQGFCIFSSPLHEILTKISTWSASFASTLATLVLERKQATAPLLVDGPQKTPTLDTHVLQTLEHAHRLTTVPAPDDDDLHAAHTLDRLVDTFAHDVASKAYVFKAGTNISPFTHEELYHGAMQTGVYHTLLFPVSVVASTPVPHWYVIVIDVKAGVARSMNSAPHVRDHGQEDRAREFAKFARARQFCRLCEEFACRNDSWACPAPQCTTRLCGMCRYNIYIGRATTKPLVERKRLSMTGQNPVLDEMKCPYCKSAQIPVLDMLSSYREKRAAKATPFVDVFTSRIANNRLFQKAYRLQEGLDVEVRKNVEKGNQLVAVHDIKAGSCILYPVAPVQKGKSFNENFAIQTRDGDVVAPPDTPSHPGHWVNEPSESMVEQVLRTGFQVLIAPDDARQSDLAMAIQYIHEYPLIFERVWSSPQIAPVATFGHHYATIAVMQGIEMMEVFMGQYDGNKLCATFNNKNCSLDMPRGMITGIVSGTPVAICIKKDTTLVHIREKSTLPFDTIDLFLEAILDLFDGPVVPPPPLKVYSETRSMLRRRLLPNALYVETFARKGKRTKIYVVVVGKVDAGDEMTTNYGWGTIAERLEQAIEEYIKRTKRKPTSLKDLPHFYFTSPYCCSEGTEYPYPEFSVANIYAQHVWQDSP
jgi:hypothetical protein